MGVMSFLANIMPTVAVPRLDAVVGSLLKLLNDGINNICVTMIVFTLMLKLVTFPLDYFSKKTMKQNQLIQEKLKPQIEKIEKQCGDNKQLAQQRKFALMRKEGYKTAGACLPVLISLGLVIYIFSAVNSFSTYTTANLYNNMAEHYTQLIQEVDEETQELKYYDEETYTLNQAGKDKMVEKFESLNPSFLWIKNPWRPDSYKSSISSYEEFKNGTIGVTALKMETEFAEQQYNQIMGSISQSKKYNGWNGILILPILAALVSFLSQFITTKMQGQPQIAGQSKTMMRVTMIMLPAITLYFALTYTSGFSIYLIFNSIFTTLSTIIISKAVNIKAKKQEVEVNSQTQGYRRR